MGQNADHALHTCAVAMRLAEAWGLRASELRICREGASSRRWKPGVLVDASRPGSARRRLAAPFRQHAAVLSILHRGRYMRDGGTGQLGRARVGRYDGSPVIAGDGSVPRVGEPKPPRPSLRADSSTKSATACHPARSCASLLAT